MLPTAPLPLSARNQPEAARVLLSAGCQPDVISGTRSAPLHLAVQRGFLEVVRVLCEHGCDVNLPVSVVPLPQPWDLVAVVTHSQ